MSAVWKLRCLDETLEESRGDDLLPFWEGGLLFFSNAESMACYHKAVGADLLNKT